MITEKKLYNSEFIRDVEAGMAGANKGIPGGLPRFDNKVYNIQPAKLTSIVGSSKSGKTAFMLWRYIFTPWINGKRNIKWVFYSLEVDIKQIKARLAAMFAYHFYNTEIDPNLVYSLGNNLISLTDYELLKKISEEHLDLLFDNITFISDANDSYPTAIYKYCLNYYNNNGKIIKEKYETLNAANQKVEKERIVGYKSDKDEEVFLIIDTLGLMKKEARFNKKENIDKWLEDYAITLRNIFKTTIINLHHLNRSVSNMDRVKFHGDELQPQLDDIKDTSGIGECSDIVISVFNPNVFKHLTEHQGYNLNFYRGTYRSLHVLASRYTECPLNLAVTFDFKTGMWKELPPPKI